MGLKASDKGDFPLTEEGVHRAVCYGVIDLGHQHNQQYDNWGHKIMIQWELPDRRIETEGVSKPTAISRRFGLSLGAKSHLRPFLESWRGKKFTFEELGGFELQNLIGVNCQIQVLHERYNDKEYANVHAVLPAAKGDKIDPETPTVFYSIEDSGLVIPEGIPEWIQNIIMKSQEYTRTDENGGYNPTDDTPPPDDSDIPF